MYLSILKIKNKFPKVKNKTTMLNEFFNVNKKEINDTNAKERSNVQKYLTNVDETFLDINNFVMQTDICETCNKGELIPVDHEGSLVCKHKNKPL